MLHKIIRKSRDKTDGSVVLAISDGLDLVKVGPRGDEEIAFLANRIVRRSLDKGAIKYGDYKAWRQKNPLIFTSIIDEKSQLIGFFDIFPLTPEAGAATVAGKLTERSFTIDHLVPFESVSSVRYVHIATILVNPRQRSFSPLVARELILIKMANFIKSYYPPVASRVYTAYAQSKAGEALLRRSRFSVAVRASDNEAHWPLYILRSSDADPAVSRFQHASSGLSTAQREHAELKELDGRIEGIELRLRTLISEKLGSDARRLPSNISGEVDKRIRQAAKKNVVVDFKRYRELPFKLEYFDLRELEATIVNTQIWALFRARFVNKDTFQSKLDQLAELRNSIRHSRTTNEITRRPYAFASGEINIL
jgi:hypothetical protein